MPRSMPMAKLFLSPDCDDEALFGSYIIMRNKPEVIVLLDGVLHQKKFGIDHRVRQEESRAGCELLGVPVYFAELTDEKPDYNKMIFALRLLGYPDWETKWDIIFAPALTGGNPNHDMVSKAATELWGDKVIYYGTYTRDNFSPDGEMAINPTEEERQLKEKVLQCYKSQIELNKPHFDAVKDKPEYLSFKPC